MIFPDLPKRRHFFNKHTAQPVNTESTVPPIVESIPGAVSADQWFAQHFPDTVSRVPVSKEPFDWRKDPRGTVEFALLCVSIIAWAAFWYQYSH
jgi:hypothetical protein